MPDSTNDELQPFSTLMQNTAVARDYISSNMTDSDINELATHIFFIDQEYKYNIEKTPIDNVFCAYRLAVSKLIHQHTEQAVRRAEAKGRLAAINSIKAWADRVETSYNDMMLKEVRHVTQLTTNPKGE